MHQDTENKLDNRSIRELRKPTYKRICRWMWILSILSVLAMAGTFTYLSFQDLPTFEELENPKNNFASEVYAANGLSLGRYYVENRVPVEYSDLSPHLTTALVSTEDERFYEHSGIDYEALARVAVRTVLLSNRNSGGGSTISQQLAKLLYPRVDFRGMNPIKKGMVLVSTKLKEWITAVKLERSYTKDEIIAMYLNKFNFINGAYGIRAASEIYFGKSQDELSLEESATLVGMLKNPALYNPMKRPERVHTRRMVVMNQMVKNNYLTQIDYDSLKVLPLDMTNFQRKTHADGLAPYFRMELRKELGRILSEDENKKPDGTKYDIYRDGLKIYTTLDPVIQKHAEEAMLEHMESQQRKFWKRWEGKDPWTYREEETTDEMIAIRERSLQGHIYESDRYQRLRSKFLSKPLEKVKKQIDGYDLKDRDIVRIIGEEEKAGNLAKLVKQKMISNKRANIFRSAMKLQDWPELKKQWNALQDKVKADFQKKYPMKVFAYNDKMEKDTLMTPLDSIKYHRMFLQFGSIAVHPVTGHVKAWVGGINHKYFQYDHVTAERQVGSTFKPFIYATAIDQHGISPCYRVYDVPHTIHKGEGNFKLLDDWTPQNAGEEFSGELFTLMKGLQYSKNTVSVYLMKQLGSTDPVRTMVNNMGIDVDHKRGNGTLKVPKQPSICLGAADLTVMEMAGAYTTFANNGKYNKPIFISKIVDRNGRTIYQGIPEDRSALNEKINWVMVQMLKSVMNQGLPGFQNIKSEVGGKTGTTNDYVDGWFMGVTPDLVVGTWVGGEDPWVRFTSLYDGIGARMARPFFAKLLNRLEADETSTYNKTVKFIRPPGDIGIEMDCTEYVGDDPDQANPGFDDTDNAQFGGDFADDMDDDFGDDDSFGDDDDTEGDDAEGDDDGFGDDDDSEEEIIIERNTTPAPVAPAPVPAPAGVTPASDGTVDDDNDDGFGDGDGDW